MNWWSAVILKQQHIHPKLCSLLHRFWYSISFKHVMQNAILLLAALFPILAPLSASRENCGDPRFELVCNKNVTFLSLNTRKYYVKEINYHNSSLRLVEWWHLLFSKLFFFLVFIFHTPCLDPPIFNFLFSFLAILT